MNNKNFKFRIDERNIQLILNRIKTNPKLKWILILGFIIIPYTLFWVLFGGTGGSNFFLWLNDQTRLSYVIIDYGIQWAIACTWAILALIIVHFMSKKNKDIKKDVYFPIVGWTFVMTNFWLIPIGLWTLLLAVPFYIAGVAIVIIVQIFLFMKNYQKNLEKMQNDFPNVFNQNGSDQNNNDPNEIKIEDNKKDKKNSKDKEDTNPDETIDIK